MVCRALCGRLTGSPAASVGTVTNGGKRGLAGASIPGFDILMRRKYEVGLPEKVNVKRGKLLLLTKWLLNARGALPLLSMRTSPSLNVNYV